MSRFLLITVTALACSATGALAAAAPRGLQTLWHVGTSDNSTAEFTNAPKDYQKYRQPGFFVVGVSDPKNDWPYVQPGTTDGGWAPGTPQTFAILFGLEAIPKEACRLILDLVDTHSVTPPKLRVKVNDKAWEFQAPKGAGNASIHGDPSKGREHVIKVDVPARVLKKGNNVVSITTLNASWILWDAARLAAPTTLNASWILWDAARFEAPVGTTTIPVTSYTSIGSISTKPNILVWNGKQPAHAITINILHVGDPVEATLSVGGVQTAFELKSGSRTMEMYAEPVEEAGKVKAVLTQKDKMLSEAEIAIKPVRQWELHIVHQTHLDIGYTHKQEEVLKLQVEWLYRSMEYIEKSKDHPEGAKFKWHPEGMWAVDEFMRTAKEEDKKQFIEDCRKGQIHLDVLYAQAMTGLYNEEELMELMGAAKRFEKEHDVPIRSAMQSDVPGYTWGLAAALGHCNVSQMSVGPNPYHRIGHTYSWGDKPFWWVSPSGKHKVLFWMCGDGYYGFKNLTEGAIIGILNRLEKKGFPYDLAMVRMLSGVDNAPPNPGLSDAVRAWNKKYAYPRIVVSGNSEFLARFAEKHGSELKEVKGDFTPYWEDGCASTSKATGINRRAGETIIQLQILWSMLNPSLKLNEKFDVAWNKLIMYDEHTWGADCSISQPDSAFSVQQDNYKQAYAFDGATLTDDLYNEITKTVEKKPSASIDVFNTLNWQRSQLVLLSKKQTAVGDLVKNDKGIAVPSQRLSSGELAFMAEDVPAFGARRYTVNKGAAEAEGKAVARGNKLGNGLISLVLDSENGAIQSLKREGIEADLVAATGDKATGLNDYLYHLGRDDRKGFFRIDGEVQITVEDAGPLVATTRVESSAPGCKALTRKITVVDGSDRVMIDNITDKLKQRQPEGVYFSFPFNIPKAISRIDVPWAVVQVEKDQMVGANRNFYCVQRWVDLSNDDYGVTWVTLDAPIMQFDPIKIATARGLHKWRTKIEPGAHIYSWVMNNHWEANYKAYQEGIIAFHYALVPHTGGYDAVRSQRVAREIHQPLLAVPADSSKAVVDPLFDLIGSKGVVVTSVRPSREGNSWMVRLFNTAEQTCQVSLRWQRPVKTTWISNPMEEKKEQAPSRISMVQHEIVTLRVER